MLALTAPRASVSPKSYIVKDDKMFNSTKSKVALLGAGVVTLASNASAALTATDVSMTAATADMAVVFIAVLGVAVIAFGYRQIKKLI